VTSTIHQSLISGILDFSGGMAGALRCQQVSMALETEEVVSTSASSGGGGGGGGGASVGSKHSLELAEEAGSDVPSCQFAHSVTVHPRCMGASGP